MGGFTLWEVEVEAPCEGFAEFADGLFVLHGTIVPDSFHFCSIGQDYLDPVLGFDARFSELLFYIWGYCHSYGAYFSEASYPVSTIAIGVGVSLPIVAGYLTEWLFGFGLGGWVARPALTHCDGGLWEGLWGAFWEAGGRGGRIFKKPA